MENSMETEENVTNDNDLELDVSILTEQRMEAGISLCDLYGIPIFTSKSAEQIKVFEEKNSEENTYIEQRIFLSTFADKEKEELEAIRSQVFTGTESLTKQGIEHTEAGGTMPAFFWIELLLIVLLLTGYLYSVKKRRERKRKLDSIDNIYEER